MNINVQKWLVNSLAGAIGAALSRPLAERLVKEVPSEQRSIEDDIKEATFKAGVALVSTFVASVLVRRLVR